MTWSLTLAEQPREGAISNPHHYRKEVRKTKDIPITWVPTRKQFEDFRLEKNIPSLDQTTPWNTRPLKATIDGVLCNQEEINRRKIEKKTFRLKLLEICKTRTMKSSPDMLNFNVVLQVMTKSLTLADHHVQVPIQSPITFNKKYKNWRISRKHGF